jgi:hypothetical protein
VIATARVRDFYGVSASPGLRVISMVCIDYTIYGMDKAFIKGNIKNIPTSGEELALRGYKLCCGCILSRGLSIDEKGGAPVEKL